jgi:tetratricopeptide (TPR) repeat protein
MADRTRRRRAAAYLKSAERMARGARGPQRVAWLEQVEREPGPLEEALECFFEAGDAEAGVRLVRALRPFWRERGHAGEGRAWLGRLLALPAAAADPAVRAAGLDEVRVLAGGQRDYAAGRRAAEEVVVIRRTSGDPAATARALETLGTVTRLQGDDAAAEAAFREALALRRALGTGAGDPLLFLGRLARYQGDAAKARPLVEEALAEFRARGNEEGAVEALFELGSVEDVAGEYAAARAAYEECLALQRARGDRTAEANTLTHLGWNAYYERDYAAARARFEGRLAISTERGDKPGIAGALLMIGHTYREEGNYAAAHARYEQALHLREELADFRGLPRLQIELGALLLLEDDAAAWPRVEEGLRAFREQGDWGGICWALDRLAGAAAVAGRATRAMQLLGAADALRAARGHPRVRRDQPELDRWLDGARQRLSADARAAAYATGRALGADEAIALALAGVG